MDQPELNAETLLYAYANGIFPMAESQDSDQIYWMSPEKRGIIPLDGFHISRSTARLIKQEKYKVTFNSAFEKIVDGCAARDDTWINDHIKKLCRELFELGFAQSVEVWDNKQLIGGTYGIILCGAYIGESMFSWKPNASKIALTYQVAYLRKAGYQLFDTQYLTPHLQSLGGIEISQEEYLKRLQKALKPICKGSPQSSDITMQTSEVLAMLNKTNMKKAA